MALGKCRGRFKQCAEEIIDHQTHKFISRRECRFRITDGVESKLIEQTCRLPLPTGNWVRFLFVPVLMFVSTAIDRNYQTDMWHHLARGRAIVAEGRLLDTDRFTFTMAGKPFQDVNWLWQVSFYYLHELGGLPLVQTVNSIVLALMMAGLLILAWRRSQSLRSSPTW